jgi:hypothetical protein
LKLFEATGMDGSFSMSSSMQFLDSWFKNYGVFKFSAQVWASFQLVAMQLKLPKSTKIFPNLTTSLRNFKIPPKIKNFMFSKKQEICV